MSSVFKALKDGFFFTIEFDKHLFLGANQIVAPLMKGISHFTWKGKKLPVVLVDKIGCYYASPFGLRLNDHCGVRQTRNDTVANKKVFAVKLFLSGKFRKNPPLLLDSVAKNAVLWRINLIQTMCHASNGSQIGF